MPGVAVAVSRKNADGKSELVLTKGYGYADLATLEKTTGKHLYRIASISKPITAIAILKLVEQGKFGLDDSVLKLLPLGEAIAAAGDQFDQRWHKITVRHLLQHRGGWDRDKSFDAHVSIGTLCARDERGCAGRSIDGHCVHAQAAA